MIFLQHTLDLPQFDTSTQESSWLLTKKLDSCTDQNGDIFPDPARLANTDYFSYGHGKYNLDKPIFAKLPGGMWALHDFRTQFKSNTPNDLMEGMFILKNLIAAMPNSLTQLLIKDGGGAAMKAAARSGDNDDGNPDTDLVVRCSNVQRNVFNEATCQISYHEDACVSAPLYGSMHDPTYQVDELSKYVPNYAGPDHGGVVSE